jgi:hypothetical protein
LGEKLLVFGGNLTEEHVGAIYDVSADTWSEYSQSGVQTEKGDSSLASTGKKFVTFGTGNIFKYSEATTDLYDPATDSWEPGLSENVPSRRTFQSAAWTGSTFFVWGGRDYSSNGLVNTGGLFYYLPLLLKSI